MKLLATDYDGTLCYGKHVMPEDIEAIKKWQDEGNLYVIATGRSAQSIMNQMDEIQLEPDFYITNNGGMVFDKERNELLANHLDYITAIDILYAVKEDSEVASYVVNDGFARHRIIVNPQITDTRYPTLQPDMSEEQTLSMPQYGQLVISMSNEQEALRMASQINEFFGSYVEAYPNRTCVDVVPKDISKGAGLEFVAEFSDTDDNDIYTMGDNYNDISLIEYGFNGAAIEMAPEDVKEAAKNIYASVSDMIKNID